MSNDPNADPNDPNDWVMENYLHGDLIDSTGLITDSGGTGIVPVMYTAFGEILDGPGGGLGGGGSPSSGSAGILPAGHPRFAYAGGHGYETATTGNTPGPEGGLTLTGVNPNLPPITLQHVGFRWYQPDIGRFVQRDPAGFVADVNAYLYADADPVDVVDEAGLMSVKVWVRSVKGIWKVVKRSTAIAIAKKNSKSVLVKGAGSSRKAKTMADKAYPGKRVVRHDGHRPGWLPHYQPGTGGGRHIFYDAAIDPLEWLHDIDLEGMCLDALIDFLSEPLTDPPTVDWGPVDRAGQWRRYLDP